MGLARGVELPPAVEAACKACRDLRVERIDGDGLLRGKGVTGSVRGMEAHLIAVTEAADHRAYPVRVRQGERGMLHQALDRGERIGPARGRLNREPLVQHQRFV